MTGAEGGALAHACLAVGGLAMLIAIAGWVLYPLALAAALAVRTRRHPDVDGAHARGGVAAAHARAGAAAALPVAAGSVADGADARMDGPGAAPWPPVSCVIATREPPELVAARVADVRASSYPRERLEVVVAIDRDAPFADERYAGACGVAARVVRAEEAGGKAAALNAGVRAAAGDLVVFTDSAQRFAPHAIAALVRCFAAPEVGAVSGRLSMHEDDAGGGVLSALWRYELRVRRLESAVDSIVAVTGAVYAIRRALWPTLRAGTICDDLVVPLRVVRRGYRVAHCDAARAYDPRRFTRDQEIRRKVRTLTGMVQACAWEPWILSPRRNRVWVQFVCHKLVRLATPVLVVVAACAVAGWLALHGWLEPLASAAILLGGGWLIVLDLWRPRTAQALLDRAALALRLLGSPLLALRHALRGDWEVWRPVESQRVER